MVTSKGEGWGGCRVASSRKTPKVSCVKLDSVEKMYNCANLRYSGYEQNGKFFGGQFYGGKCQLKNCWGNFFCRQLFMENVQWRICLVEFLLAAMPYLIHLNRLHLRNIAYIGCLKHFVFVFDDKPFLTYMGCMVFNII